jgi:PIN domain nuclease of toxin-antitoxin system
MRILVDEALVRAWHHREPFDRAVVAQAVVEGAALVSRDDALRSYGITLIW